MPATMQAAARTEAIEAAMREVSAIAAAIDDKLAAADSTVPTTTTEESSVDEPPAATLAAFVPSEAETTPDLPQACASPQIDVAPAPSPSEQRIAEHLAEETPKALAAAAAEGLSSASLPAPTTDASTIASIVDSVLADLRPKLVEEIAKKLSGK